MLIAVPCTLAQAQPPVQSSQDMLAKASKAVFQLKVKAEAGVFASGTGFLIDQTGLAVTNFHVVQGASSADAEFQGVEGAVPVDLVAANPKYDLALVRVPMRDPKLAGKVSVLEVRSGHTAAGTDVWAIGFPKGLGLSVTKGVVSGVRSYTDLPEGLRRSLKYDTKSVWIQTDCTINSGNSGGPLLDGQGRVVGINTWVWLTGQNLYFALSAKHIDELVKAPLQADFSFKTAQKLYGQERQIPRAAFPRLDVTRDGTGADLLKHITAFRTGHRCKGCAGSGQVTTKERTGSTSGGGMTYPTFTNVTRQCSTCNGCGVASAERVWGDMRRLATSFARLKEDDPKAATARELLQKELRAAIQSSSAGLSERLNGKAVTVLSATTCKPGEAIVCVGRLAKDLSENGGADRFQGVVLHDRSMLVLVSEPELVDAAEGDTVLVGGLLAGRLDGSDGTFMPVLQNGFVIGVPSRAPTSRR
ncbi:MAG TPA: trypsin-like peptidase domain-containing protein [Phycisphaerales bacterium]|nr:trypsin-like peptidase domain-containing protein [Phycisphaerales bacterium]